MSAEPSSASSTAPKLAAGEAAKWWFWPATLLLLALHAAVALDVARKYTVTHDEYLHLPCGLLTAKTGRFDFDRGSPPLSRMLAAAPLLLTPAVPPPADPKLDGWKYGDAFLTANGDRYHLWVALGRSMIVLLSVAAGMALALWSREMFGDRAAVLTVLLWGASPAVISNAALVTTDLGAAALFVFTLFAAWRFARRATWSQALIFGAVLGAAQLAKFTALLLYPLAFLVWAIYRWRNCEVEAVGWRQASARWLAAMAISLAVLNAGYLFHGSFSPLGDFDFRSRTMRELSERLSRLHALPVPVPRDYMLGIDVQRAVMEGRHPVFLDGQWSTEGFPHYYVMALWYKMPHSMQLLFLSTVLLLLRPAGARRLWREQLFLLLPAVALFAFASSMRMQLGLRYLLPVYPLIVLFVGQAGRWFDCRRRRRQTLGLVVLVAAVPLSLRHHPHHLAYFNELAGGPVDGRRHLADSNLDWGQDLRALAHWLEGQNISGLRLAYFGVIPPSAVGIDYELPPSRVPQPGWYAVSVNLVQGRPYALRDAAAEYHPAGLDEFGYFRFFFSERIATIGYSIDVYHLTADDVARWRAAVLQSLQSTPFGGSLVE